MYNGMSQEPEREHKLVKREDGVTEWEIAEIFDSADDNQPDYSISDISDDEIDAFLNKRTRL